MSTIMNMLIPENLTCGECKFYPWCQGIIGVHANNRECDFYPVRFSKKELVKDGTQDKSEEKP